MFLQAGGEDRHRQNCETGTGKELNRVPFTNRGQINSRSNEVIDRQLKLPKSRGCKYIIIAEVQRQFT